MTLMETIDDLTRDMTVDEVAETEDPVLRNYLITHSYWQLSEGLRRLFGDRDLVWPAFGAWASAQAGRYMRFKAPPLVEYAPRSFKNRIMKMLGRGNQRVFADIAPPFSKFISLTETRVADELALLARESPYELPKRLTELLDLDPRPIEEHDDGQELMVMAFTQYVLAMHAESPESRTERIYVANCCVGVQEQTRIDCMLDALLDVEVANDLAPWLAWPVFLVWWSTGPMRWLVKLLGSSDSSSRLNRVANRLSKIEQDVGVWEACLLERRFSRVLGTRLFMNLNLDGELYDIDEDTPWTSADQMFPPALMELESDRPEFREYLTEIMRWDRSPNSTEDSAALDWSRLGDRMNYILDLFRTRQQDTRLATNPLSLESGELPRRS